MLNISEPTSQSLGLVSLATEEERLKLWPTMPHNNNINSEQVVGSLANIGVDSFILLNHYTWSSLASNTCPSGNLADVEADIPVEHVYFNGADLHTTIKANPHGFVPLPVLSFPPPETGELKQIVHCASRPLRAL